jgi:hypothetical protein
VLEEGPAVTQHVAAAQMGVEPVEDVDPVLQLPQGHLAERRLQRAPMYPSFVSRVVSS